MKKLLLTMAILLSACARPGAAQELACTQMWCQEGMTLTLNGTDWPTGAYKFAITADGKETVCVSHLPFTGCEGNTTCQGEGVTIGESGCAMGPETHSFHAIMMAIPPQNFSMTIEHESGKTFTYGPETVAAQCSHPNGAQCDPRPCCSASLSADVIWK